MRHYLERKHHGQLVWIFITFVLLAACAGIPTPETFNQRIGAGYASVQAVAKTTTNLLTQKRISVGDAENVLTQAKLAKESLDLSRKIYATDPAGGDAKLTAAIAILSALQTYINSKGATSGR